MSNYTYHIGLEIHIKLSSENKIFCLCQNTQDFDQSKPNQHICPICTAQPGAMPIINLECINKINTLAKLFGTDINKEFKRDRKSYFYPDIPTGYQITQFYHPIIKGGKVEFYSDNFESQHEIAVHEAHLENDTAKTTHIDKKTYIDYNRAGTPLVEIVTKPGFTSDTQVVDFLKELQKNIKSNDIGYADLEKGQMRVDVNISVSDSDILGTRVEIKNINSYSAIRNAINYEFARQSKLLSQGMEVEQETRKRDDITGATQIMRSKEDAMDYRYMPEPDLPMIDIGSSEFDDINIIRNVDIISRYKNYGFNKEYIYGIINNETIFDRFEYAIDKGYDPKLAAKRLLGGFASVLNEKGTDAILFDKDRFLSFLTFVGSKTLSDNINKQIFDEMLKEGGDPLSIATKFDTDSKFDLESIVSQVIESNPSVVEQYKSGKESVIGFFVGQGMRLTGGVADPSQLKNIFVEKLK